MILDRKPLSLSEVQEILKDIPDNEKKSQMEIYLKKYLLLWNETKIFGFRLSFSDARLVYRFSFIVKKYENP
mgnify:CR=1 FL=1